MPEINIRTTELEDFCACQYFYKHKESTPKSEQATALWTKLHRSMQSYLQWSYIPEANVRLRNEKSLELLEPELAPEERKFVNDCVSLADKNNLPNFVVTESEYKTKFVVWDYTVNITGHVDWMVDSDYLVDIKTAKQKRQEKSLLYKLQRKMYPVLFALARYPQDRLHEINIKFDYRIFTKQVTPQFQGFRLNVNVGQYYNEVYKIVKDFVLSLESGVYNTNTKSPNCYWCPLKRDGKCPAYTTQQPKTPSIEDFI